MRDIFIHRLVNRIFLNLNITSTYNYLETDSNAPDDQKKSYHIRQFVVHPFFQQLWDSPKYQLPEKHKCVD